MSIRDKYDKHVFVCVNSRGRDESRTSCGSKGVLIRDAMIEKLKDYKCGGLNIRINKAGCLNKCELGPVIVIYPQAFWYYNVELDDIDDIIKESILKNHYIERLS